MFISPLVPTSPLLPSSLVSLLTLVPSNLLLLSLLLSRYTETLLFPSHHRLSIPSFPSYLHYSTTFPHSPCLPSSPLVLHLSPSSLGASLGPLSNIQLACPFPSSPLLLGCELPNQGGRGGSLARPDGWSSALTEFQTDLLCGSSLHFCFDGAGPCLMELGKTLCLQRKVRASRKCLKGERESEDKRR